MEQSPPPTRNQSRVGHSLDPGLALLLFMAGLGARWLYAGSIAFPPSDESAIYLTPADS
jgi:hypothetical protein